MLGAGSWKMEDGSWKQPACRQAGKQEKVTATLTSGIEVFDEISREKNMPDVLLVNMYMPFFTGVDLVKALEEMHAAPTMNSLLTLYDKPVIKLLWACFFTVHDRDQTFHKC